MFGSSFRTPICQFTSESMAWNYLKKILPGVNSLRRASKLMILNAAISNILQLNLNLQSSSPYRPSRISNSPSGCLERISERQSSSESDALNHLKNLLPGINPSRQASKMEIVDATISHILQLNFIRQKNLRFGLRRELFLSTNFHVSIKKKKGTETSVMASSPEQNMNFNAETSGYESYRSVSSISSPGLSSTRSTPSPVSSDTTENLFFQDRRVVSPYNSSFEEMEFDASFGENQSSSFFQESSHALNNLNITDPIVDLHTIKETEDSLDLMAEFYGPEKSDQYTSEGTEDNETFVLLDLSNNTYIT